MPITALSHIGIAKEATWGTAVAPTKWLPVKNPTLEDDITYIRDQGLRGIAAQDFGLYQSVALGRPGYDFDFFPDAPALFVYSIMGSWSVTGTGPYTHAFSLGSSPPSLTISDYYGVNERQFAGCYVESLDIKYSPDGTVEGTVKLLGKKSAVGTVTSPTFPTNPPFLGWQATATINAGGNNRLIGAEFNLKRALKEVFGASNSQDPTIIYAGPLEVTGKLTFNMADDTELNYFLQNTQPQVQVKFTSGTDELTILMTKCAFEKASVNRGQEYVQVDATIRGIYSATDGGPCKITLKNGVATY